MGGRSNLNKLVPLDERGQVAQEVVREHLGHALQLAEKGVGDVEDADDLGGEGRSCSAVRRLSGHKLSRRPGDGHATPPACDRSTLADKSGAQAGAGRGNRVHLLSLAPGNSLTRCGLRRVRRGRLRVGVACL